MADKDSENEKNDGQKETTPSILEWIIAAVGLILVAAAFGYILYRTVAAKNTPPDLTVKIESITQISAGYLVKFRVANSGEKTAAAVNLRGTLKNGEAVEESGNLTISYVPAHSEREGGILFEKNPQNYQLQIRADGYANP